MWPSLNWQGGVNNQAPPPPPPPLARSSFTIDYCWEEMEGLTQKTGRKQWSKEQKVLVMEYFFVVSHQDVRLSKKNDRELDT